MERSHFPGPRTSQALSWELELRMLVALLRALDFDVGAFEGVEWGWNRGRMGVKRTFAPGETKENG